MTIIGGVVALVALGLFIGLGSPGGGRGTPAGTVVEAIILNLP